jgi:hypothetical protein
MRSIGANTRMDFYKTAAGSTMQLQLRLSDSETFLKAQGARDQDALHLY